MTEEEIKALREAYDTAVEKVNAVLARMGVEANKHAAEATRLFGEANALAKSMNELGAMVVLMESSKKE